MSILKYKTKDGRVRYRVRIYEDYQVIADQVFDTKAEALMFKSRANVNKADRKIQGIVGRDMTVSQFWNEVYLPTKGSQLNPSTVGTYKHLFRKHLEPTFGERDMREVRTEEIMRTLSTISRTIGPVTLNKVRQVFAGLYSHGKKLSYVSVNPLDTVPKAKNPAIKDDFKWWEFKFAKQFLEWCRTTDCPRYLMYRMVLEEGGMRPGEVIALKRDQLDLKKQFYRVCRSYNRATRTVENDTKTNRSRHVGLSPELCELLRVHLASHQSDYVFPNVKGMHFQYENLKTIFQKDCDKAGVPCIGLNGLRHTFASHFIMRGGSEVALAKILGHVSTAMLRRYVHLAQEYLLNHRGILQFERMAEDIVVIPARP